MSKWRTFKETQAETAALTHQKPIGNPQAFEK